MTQIKRSSETVLIFDGLRLWQFDGNKLPKPPTDPLWISARHNKRTAANVLMADGHAQTLHVKSLPQDRQIFGEHIDPIQLSQKWPYPRWRMDQK